VDVGDLQGAAFIHADAGGGRINRNACGCSQPEVVGGDVHHAVAAQQPQLAAAEDRQGVASHAEVAGLVEAERTVVDPRGRDQAVGLEGVVAVERLCARAGLDDAHPGGRVAVSDIAVNGEIAIDVDIGLGGRAGVVELQVGYIDHVAAAD